MRIVVDSREQRPFTFERFGVETERASLGTGDYSLNGFLDKVGIERKSLDDLVSCLMGDGRIRFEKELVRGRSLELFAVCVEASMEDVREHRYCSQMAPASALQSIIAFSVRYGTSFLWCGNRETAELVCYSLLQKYCRELEERFKQLERAS
ncbi:MAG: ERCC4 domain-containing protein [Candidatus Micrarchaeia archaeon]|jgi:ERCC4-type nuclease